MELRITHDLVAGHDVVSLEGVADLSTVPQLQNALARATATLETASLVVDLDAATVIGDVAIGLLVGTAARCRDEAVEFALVASNPKTRARLADTRVDRIVSVRTSIS